MRLPQKKGDVSQLPLADTSHMRRLTKPLTIERALAYCPLIC